MTTTDNTASRTTDSKSQNGAAKQGKSDKQGASAREGTRESGQAPRREKQRDDRREERPDERQEEPRAEQEEQLALSDVLPLATGQLAELLRCEPGSVSSVKATDTGWTADVEVVELERIPETTSVMGSYRVQLDRRGRLTGYERLRRYSRGQLDQGGKSR